MNQLRSINPVSKIDPARELHQIMQDESVVDPARQLRDLALSLLALARMLDGLPAADTRVLLSHCLILDGASTETTGVAQA